MISNIIHFKETINVTKESSLPETISLPNAICLSETICLPEMIRVSKYSSLLETVLLLTSHQAPKIGQLPILTCFTDFHSSPEIDASLETNFPPETHSWAFRSNGTENRVKDLRQVLLT